MSERLAIQTPEHHEALPSPERPKAIETAANSEPLRPGEADPLKKIGEVARNDIESTASSENPLARIEAEEASATDSAQPQHVNRELKNITLARELKSIQRKLPAPQRALSKVVHQKAVRAVSEASAKTVTRPSGLLGGGLLAFVGTLAYLLFTKYMGIQYNYAIFLLLFVGGFLLGLLLELVVWTLTSRHRSSE